MKTLTIVGGGRVGQTLGRLWCETRTFKVRQVLNRSAASAQAAVGFIGEGVALSSLSALEPTDIYLLSTPDARIETCCQDLAETDLLISASVVLHCSGSLSVSVLSAAQQKGARIASVHPVKSFADPALAVESFSGTHCGMEGVVGGEEDVVAEAFRQIGGVLFEINPDQKSIYHAGTVFASNYLVALAEMALRCFERAGLDREEATQLMAPILRGTVDNVLRLGTTNALTGPIARGDHAVVARHLAALSECDIELAQAYVVLGRTALDLSSRLEVADQENLEMVQRIFT